MRLCEPCSATWLIYQYLDSMGYSYQVQGSIESVSRFYAGLPPPDHQAMPLRVVVRCSASRNEATTTGGSAIKALILGTAKSGALTISETCPRGPGGRPRGLPRRNQPAFAHRSASTPRGGHRGWGPDKGRDAHRRTCGDGALTGPPCRTRDRSPFATFQWHPAYSEVAPAFARLPDALPRVGG